METVVRHPVVRQFVKFGLVGTLSAGIDWGIFFLLDGHFKIFYLLAKIISFVFAAVNSYIWNRRWTFRSKSSDRAAEFSRFFVVSTVGAGLNAILMMVTVEHFSQPKIVGLMVATGVSAVWNFAANRCWTFKKVEVCEQEEERPVGVR